MGFSIKFNWVLQIDIPQDLEPGACYEFFKEGNRVYPLETPIDLIDFERSAVAKIRVMSFTNSVCNTVGKYEVVKVYAGIEKEVLTNYWIENEN